jgi:hypothetical protein
MEDIHFAVVEEVIDSLLKRAYHHLAPVRGTQSDLANIRSRRRCEEVGCLVYQAAES